ncbi:EAL domain-containing protein [Citrobacter amalonaticus]|uniref:EAL domain-containing protein n=1 Tax=Citrobacter amalonaticus TaxID=35703 RepID=A0A8I0MK15_CITAM|nr:EAL domain-containing protein [Citrobacter amalonaticus]MBE0128416.1 EAL domain-containing protein [Citrobacter amalonaticus]
MEQMCTDYQEHVQRAAPGAEAAEYIVSPCGFAALALSEIFNAEQKKYRVLTKLADLKDTDILLKLHETPILRATVYLPLEPVPFLQTLRVLTLLLRNSTIPLDILIITRCSSGWLYKTLLRILRKPFYLSAITVVDVGVSGSFINEVLLQKCHAPTLALHARQESSNIQRNLQGINESELDAVHNYLLGKSIEEQHNQSGFSLSRLYALRRTGIQKIRLLGPSFATLTRGEKVSWKEKKSLSGVRILNSTDSIAFSSAMRDGLITPTFKPYVNGDRKVTGFELQARWYRGDNKLQGNQFFTESTSKDLWVELISWKLAAAVQRINKCSGRYWFSVKIPHKIIDGRLLPRLVENALKRLLVREWAQRLILEFSALNGIQDTERSDAILLALKSFGCKLILNYSMFRSGLTFPFRQHLFDSFKLDMEIFNNFSANDDEEKVIKALVYFCRLSGSRCMVSGIDSQSDYDELISMGVDDFQGPIISESKMEGDLMQLFIRGG